MRGDFEFSNIFSAALFVFSISYVSIGNAQSSAKDIQPQSAEKSRPNANEKSESSSPSEKTNMSVQIDALALNAFLVWLYGNANPQYKYPPGYQKLSGDAESDQVFYLRRNDVNTEDGYLVLRSTEGAKVEGDLLKYSEYNGRRLDLRFSSLSVEKMKHAEAIKYCEKKKQRLPSLRELFDFCTADTKFVPLKELAGGLSIKDTFPESRCREIYIWSSTVSADRRGLAWAFNGYGGRPSVQMRYEKAASVRCVSGNSK